MTQTVLLDKRQLTRGFDEMTLTMTGNKEKRSFSGESDGMIASLAHVDSEDSSAPKRKCMSLNRGGFDGFDVPVEVFTLSKLSLSERKSLELRLRSEVEQVKALHRKLISVKGKPGPVKPAPSNGPVGTSQAKLLKDCDALLKKLMTHKYAWVFNSPVDVVKLNIPDYLDIIKHPMDFGTIKSKIATGSYTNPWGFVADVRLTFTNAMTYNPPSNNVHVMADTMSKFFEMRWRPIEKKLAVADASARAEIVEVPKSAPPTKKKRTGSVLEELPIVTESIKPRMTFDERQRLGQRLMSVSAELPDYIIDFLRQCSRNGDQNGDDEIEIEIDSLDDDMLFELQKLLDRYMQEKQEGCQAKPPDTCEVEVLNVSGISNSSMHPCKDTANDPMEEDVDICGDDAPVTSYPPVPIETDVQETRAGNNSPSSSSSDSGSSSSDSDSSSSSGSESHDRAVSPSKKLKENVRSELPLDQEKSDIISSLDVNRSGGGLDIPEQDAQSRPEYAEGEENASKSERQASPEKLYRAALLRSRFADTIVKAREKMLNQGEKADPEKARREREELERQQKEEKARILAEAKAAEEACKRAEAEAEAEAKRKRELEREAARQALLQMEKTVEMNDSVIMKDLEMLRTAMADHIVSSVDETSPDNSPEGLPPFIRPGGTNPLEQLGLFMKADDDDEEEDDLPNTLPVNDVTEEGEID